jgi:putative transposase
MEKENIRYSRKIPIYTSKEHKILFKKCFDITRYFYNKAVYHSNEQYNNQKAKYEASKICLKDDCETKLLKDEKFFCKKHKKSKLKWNIETSFQNLRREILVSDKELGDKDLWQKEVPYDTRQLAIKSYTSSLKAALSNYKNGNIKHFRMGYKKKKNKKQICFINKRAINDLRIFKSRLKTPVRVRNRYKVYREYKPESDCILMKDHNKYYLLIPKSKEVEYKKSEYDTVSLDPGRNTFQTFYSPNGVCGKLGDNWYLELEKMCKRIDYLQSLRSKVYQSSRKRRGLEILHWKLRIKMKNVVSDMHWKMCDYLTKSYKNIIISDFMTSKMISYSKLNRDLKTLSHYKFKCKLEEKCKNRKRNLIITTEEYTSKTCGKCGKINNVGLKRVFTCEDCRLKIDRDYNGARNILLKYISQG